MATTIITVEKSERPSQNVKLYALYSNTAGDPVTVMARNGDHEKIEVHVCNARGDPIVAVEETKQQILALGFPIISER